VKITDEVIKQYGLSEFQSILKDRSSEEDVAWGHILLNPLGEDKFNELRQYGELVFIEKGKWGLALKKLTKTEVIEKYGPLTSEELGPRGGFKSAIYGATKFRTNFDKF